MAVIEVRGGPITHRRLMNKTKDELARMVLDQFRYYEDGRVLQEVGEERRRQIMAEGWSFDHDDKYIHGELARAAACYALHECAAEGSNFAELVRSLIAKVWPWPHRWWKPKLRRRDLVRAAALIVAEIERLDRAEEKGAA